LCMYVEERDIYTGAALRALPQSNYEGYAFPLVREFTLVLESSPSNEANGLGESELSDESDESGELNHSDQSNEPVNMDEVYQANVSAFISWIKQMIPKVNDVCIEIDGYSDLDITFADHFSRLSRYFHDNLDLIRNPDGGYSLPLLSDLYAQAPSFGSMPDGVTMDELPEYMVSTYAPMGERFRCWRIICYTSNVENIILLALICPNFDYAAVHPEYRELSIAHMRDKIQADGFRHHEEWLRRLLFGGWENKFSNADIAQARLDAARKELFGN
ncbi:hypothetical protein GGI17_006630, partial [Coemansia sp. S146]